MTIWSVISTVLTKASGIVSVIVSIGKQVLPFITAAREVVPAVDGVLDRVEEVMASGGAEADDFFDRNLPVLEDLREVFQDLAEFGNAGADMMNEAIIASQQDTPDEITIEEAKRIAVKIDILRHKGVKLATFDDLEMKLAELGH